MSTYTISNRICQDDETPYSATGYNSCWEWVASLPGEQDNANLNADSSSTNEPSMCFNHYIPVFNMLTYDLFLFLLVLAGSDFIVRKKGILGINNGGKHNNAADIYQLALATRKARDRHSVVSEGPR